MYHPHSLHIPPSIFLLKRCLSRMCGCKTLSLLCWCFLICNGHIMGSLLYTLPKLGYIWLLYMNCGTLIRLGYSWWLLLLYGLDKSWDPSSNWGSWATPYKDGSKSTSSSSSSLLDGGEYGVISTLTLSSVEQQLLRNLDNLNNLSLRPRSSKGCPSVPLWVLRYWLSHRA